jgi:hypothetical protein
LKIQNGQFEKREGFGKKKKKKKIQNFPASIPHYPAETIF